MTIGRTQQGHREERHGFREDTTRVWGSPIHTGGSGAAWQLAGRRQQRGDGSGDDDGGSGGRLPSVCLSAGLSVGRTACLALLPFRPVDEKIGMAHAQG